MYFKKEKNEITRINFPGENRTQNLIQSYNTRKLYL